MYTQMVDKSVESLTMVLGKLESFSQLFTYIMHPLVVLWVPSLTVFNGLDVLLGAAQ